MESDVGNNGVDGRRFDGFMARPKLSDNVIVPRMEAPKKEHLQQKMRKDNFAMRKLEGESIKMGAILQRRL